MNERRRGRLYFSLMHALQDGGNALSGIPRLMKMMIPDRSWERFEAQSQAYRDEVLPPTATRRVAVEAGVPMGWERYVGRSGRVVAQHGFGKSAPWKDLADHFGFTVDRVVDVAQELLA